MVRDSCSVLPPFLSLFQGNCLGITWRTSAVHRPCLPMMCKARLVPGAELLQSQPEGHIRLRDYLAHVGSALALSDREARVLWFPGQSCCNHKREEGASVFDSLSDIYSTYLLLTLCNIWLGTRKRIHFNRRPRHIIAAEAFTALQQQ